MIKKYRRKLVFFRLFYNKSPQSGVVYGISWQLFWVIFAPCLMFLSLYLFGTNTLSVLLTLSLLLLGLIVTYVIIGSNLSLLLRPYIKNKKIRIFLSGLGAIFNVISPLFLLPNLIKEKRFWGIICVILNLIFIVLFHVTDKSLFLLGVIVTFLLPFIAVKNKRKFFYSSLSPLIGIIILVVVLGIAQMKLQNRVDEIKSLLSEKIGFSIDIENLKNINTQGFPLDNDPLKGLITHSVAADNLYRINQKNKDLTMPIVKDFHEKTPDFIKYLEEFLKLDIDKVAHKNGSTFYDVNLPELKAFRVSARYLALEMQAEPKNKKRVFECNKKLIKLRKWLENDMFLISHLVGSAIEAIRLDALKVIIADPTWSEEELMQLISDRVDWYSIFRKSIGVEAGAAGSVMEVENGFLYNKIKEDKRIVYKNIAKPFYKVFFYQDYLFLLECHLELNKMEEYCHLPALDVANHYQKQLKIPKDKYYPISEMLMPTLDTIILKIAQMNDEREARIIAVKVMEYYKKQGKLPDTLASVEYDKLSETLHNPFGYEKTERGFKVYYDKPSLDLKAKPIRYSVEINI